MGKKIRHPKQVNNFIRVGYYEVPGINIKTGLPVTFKVIRYKNKEENRILSSVYAKKSPSGLWNKLFTLVDDDVLRVNRIPVP